MSQFNVHEWNHKRRLSEIEEQPETTVFLVMRGKGMQMGPSKVFRTRQDAEAHAAQDEKNFMDTYREKLDTQIIEIPMG